MDWLSVLVVSLTSWTPLSIGGLVVFLAVFFALAWAGYRHRAVIVLWFVNRSRETSSEHAFYLAAVSSVLWLLDLAQMLPDGDHVPIGVVKLAWGGAICLFIKRDKIRPATGTEAG